MESPGNLGFAGGNNIGLQYCARKYVLLLNNDTIVRSGQSIKGLVEFLESHPDAGIAQGSIVLPKANGMAGLGVGSVPPRLIGTPTAGKSASLTFRLVRRASQPITISKMFLAASAMATPTSTSPSHNMLKYLHAQSHHIRNHLARALRGAYCRAIGDYVVAARGREGKGAYCRLVGFAFTLEDCFADGVCWC